MTARYGFPRRLRLLTSRDFSNVFDNVCYRSSRKGLLLLARPNQHGYPRLGFVLAKKNIKLATNRNQLKRIIRDEFRLLQHTLPPVDIVVLARNPAVSANKTEIRQHSCRLFEEICRQHEKQITC